MPAAFWRVPCLLLVSGLTATSAVHAEYQPVISLSCTDGDLVIVARPYRQVGAGYSSVAVRYIYRGIELNAVHQNEYYENLLVPYLEKAAPHAHYTGLYESEEGHWQSWLYSKRGETLFLPPAQFTAKEVEHLAACIQAHQQRLSLAFSNAKILGRRSQISGLEKGIALDGIAFLMHADFPLVDIYADDWQVLFIEHDGRVLLYRYYIGTEAPPEAITLGQVISKQSTHRKPKLLLQTITNKEGTVIHAKDWTKALRSLINRQGNNLLDNYNIVSKP